MYASSKNNHGFHTKGYLFKKKDSWNILLGSSNLTSADYHLQQMYSTLY